MSTTLHSPRVICINRLRGCGIGDAAVTALANGLANNRALKHLEYVGMYENVLIFVSLSGNEVAAEGIEFIFDNLNNAKRSELQLLK